MNYTWTSFIFLSHPDLDMQWRTYMDNIIQTKKVQSDIWG